MDKENIQRFIDEDGKVTMLPKKKAVRYLLLAYITTKFEKERFYSEKEVNAICDKWHTFNDLFIIRRELVDKKLLKREPDGSRYWVNDEICE